MEPTAIVKFWDEYLEKVTQETSLLESYYKDGVAINHLRFVRMWQSLEQILTERKTKIAKIEQKVDEMKKGAPQSVLEK